MPADALVSTLLHAPLVHLGASAQEISGVISRGTGRLTPPPSAETTDTHTPTETDSDLLSLLNASLAEQCQRLTAENNACRGRNATLAAELRSRLEQPAAPAPASPRKKRRGHSDTLAHRLLNRAIGPDNSADPAVVTLSQEEYARLRADAADPPLALLREEAAEKGCRLVSIAEWEAAQARGHPTLLTLIQEAKLQGYTVVSTGDYDAMWEMYSAAPEERAARDAALSNSVVVSLQQHAQLSNPPLLSLIQQCKLQGYTVVSDGDYAGMMETTTAPSKEWLSGKAAELGAALVPAEEYAALLETRDKPSLQFLENAAKQHGCVLLSSDEHAQLANPSLLSLIQQCKLRGYTVVSDADYDAMWALSSAAPEDRAARDAAQCNSVVVSLQQHAQLTNPSMLSLIQQCKLHGHTVISDGDYAQLMDSAAGATEAAALREELAHPPLTYLYEKARGLGQIVLPLEQYEQLRGSGDEQFDVTQEVAQDDVESVRLAARRLGMLCVPEDSFVATAQSSEPPEDGASVVVLPREYYDGLLGNKPELSESADDELVREVRRRGLGVSPTQDTFTLFSGDNDSKRTSMHSSGEKRAQPSTNYVATTPSRSKEQTPPLGKAPRSIHTGISTGVSIDGAMSLASMTGVADRSIIPAISHTVVGEYAYKYYSRLGSFGGGETSHRRYFWVHPYTLTLYWSDTKPGANANTAHEQSGKTKSAQILSVRSVATDAGGAHSHPKLYTKSIVVSSRDKEIKFTCATRQRHNIWMNALRYLIQRNAQGLDLQDIFNDPSDDLYSGNIYSVPQDPAATSMASRSVRVSSRPVSRRSSLSRFLK